MPDAHHAAMVEAITKEYMDKGLIIEAGWQSLTLLVMSPHASVLQRTEMRKAFFAGAQHLFGAIMSTLDGGEEPTADDLRRLDLIDGELRTFADDLRAELRGPDDV